jgi:uncharacterized protein YabE (DUF348 family)/3D (Asp-Asp-Asp) domain-containing protein
VPNGGAGAGTLAAAYAPGSFGAAGRGLIPLDGQIGGRALGLNVPFWALLSLFAAFSVLWGTTVGAIGGIGVVPAPALPSLVAVADRASAVVEAVRSTAAAFPQAKSIVVARLRPGQPSDWLLVEVDGKALRTRTNGAGVDAALASAGITLDDGDHVLVVPNEGAALAASVGRPRPFTLPVPLNRVVVERAVPFSVVDSGVPYSARVAASTVGEALRLAGIDVDSADLVQPPAEAPLAPGLRVAIMRAQPVAVVGADVQIEGRSRAPTVADLLAEWNVPLGPLDRVEPPPDTTLAAGGTVRVVRVREEEQKELRLVPFRTDVRYDPRLIPGTRIRVQVGVVGLVERLTKTIFEDEAIVQRFIAGESIVRAPVDEIFTAGPAVIPAVSIPALPLAGSAALPEGMAVRRVVSMVATGYDPGPASTGKRPGDPGYGITASGMRAGYGVVAVDPRVIPFYTRLYIPGYGYAIAADTGSDIVGNRIDLGFTTYSEAISWGRRPVQVYVLDPS